MVKIVSFINLKGGVGKTTTAVNIASILAENHNERVLVIDLDPQTNATVSLIDQPHWQRLHNNKQTLYHLFDDMLSSTSNFNINQAVVKDVSGIKGLDLLPSSLELINIQDQIPDISNKMYVSHVDVLSNAIAKIKDEYSYIIIDCPPNLGSITLNGINISEYYIVPTIPDILSVIGINLIINRITDFKKRKQTCNINMAGIVFTKIDNRTNLHASTMNQLRSGNLSQYVFTAELPQRISISEAPIDSRPFVTSPTAQGKSDWKSTLNLIQNITDEFITRTP